LRTAELNLIELTHCDKRRTVQSYLCRRRIPCHVGDLAGANLLHP